ncbi:hypothetical protein OIE69_44170 (plasmid) [Actinacidiphila glaucinigra]|uniref:hypothetical protein n=1 Tax=Actinacidiphila glaucinigra TaxID=235986 RepID=UPI002DDA157F|nr:hypothetical protein [Actinacidiphila glaucinigra]WSD65901.1 hypothetical protein OIE69_44170 [Actinacidiphila glaucinigra]
MDSERRLTTQGAGELKKFKGDGDEDMVSAAKQPERYQAVFVDMHNANQLEPPYATLRGAQKRCERDLTGAWTGDGVLELSWELGAEAKADAVPSRRWRMMMKTNLHREPVSSGYEVLLVADAVDVQAGHATGDHRV